MRPYSTAIIALTITLTACASAPGTKNGQDEEQIARVEEQDKVMAAITAPLNDLNLLQRDINASLKIAASEPYPQRVFTCDELAQEVRVLNEALGPDFDAPFEPDSRSLVEKGIMGIGDSAIGTIKGAAEGLLPYRKWFRQITGAERSDKEKAAALAAGSAKRSFLKGLGQAQGCEAPAAPLRQSMPQAAKEGHSNQQRHSDGKEQEQR